MDEEEKEPAPPAAPAAESDEPQEADTARAEADLRRLVLDVVCAQLLHGQLVRSWHAGDQQWSRVYRAAVLHRRREVIRTLMAKRMLHKVPEATARRTTVISLGQLTRLLGRSRRTHVVYRAADTGSDGNTSPSPDESGDADAA